MRWLRATKPNGSAAFLPGRLTPERRSPRRQNHHFEVGQGRPIPSRRSNPSPGLLHILDMISLAVERRCHSSDNLQGDETWFWVKIQRSWDLA